jgi:putative membrane protein
MKGYEDFNEELILRDYLAYDRTRLSLMRTFLSFGRTSLGLLASGIGLLIVRSTLMIRIIGWFMIIVAGIVFIFGVVICFHYKRRLDVLDND